MESPEEQEEKEAAEAAASDQQENDPRGEGIEGGSSGIGGGVADKISAEDVPDDLKPDDDAEK
jgi:hypothetical protein